jgi:phospholipase/carboxylesterase
MAELSHVHRFEPASRPGRPALLLLHGTGGDENDLVPLVEMVSAGSAFVSPRGNVLENGMPRFFRRLAEGVLDEDDVRRRANELADFIAEARTAYDLPAPIALGFSNGANVAAAVMLLLPDALAGAVLMRAMVPLAEPPGPTGPARRRARPHPLRRRRSARAGGERRPARRHARAGRRQRAP